MNDINTPRAPIQEQGPIVITSTAWALGFRDAANGASIFDGYQYFVGSKLRDYREGWANGQRVRQPRNS